MKTQTNSKIFEIKELLKQRRTPLIREKLDELEKDLKKLDNLQDFLDEIKRLCRESGRTTVVSIQTIENLIVKYGDKK